MLQIINKEQNNIYPHAWFQTGALIKQQWLFVHKYTASKCENQSMHNTCIIVYIKIYILIDTITSLTIVSDAH